jgi:hypothetical protein
MTGEKKKAIAAALNALTEQAGGRLTPSLVVEAAADPQSVLHDQFEWDDSKASKAWRLDQARTLIRSVHVRITTETTSVSVVAYVRDPDASGDEQGYVSTARIMDDKDRARAALIGEFERVASLLKRARELAIAFDMVGEVDAMTESVTVLHTRLATNVQTQQIQ